MKTTIKSPALLLMVSLLLGGCEKEEPKAKLTPLQQKLAERREGANDEKAVTLKGVEMQAASTLLDVKMHLQADDAVAEAERDLETKIAAGAAQLAAIKLQDAKAKAQEKGEMAKESMAKLEAMERAAAADPRPSIAIQELERIARQNIAARTIELKYRGRLSVRWNTLFTEWLWLSITIRMDDVQECNWTPPANADR